MNLRKEKGEHIPIRFKLGMVKPELFEFMGRQKPNTRILLLWWLFLYTPS